MAIATKQHLAGALKQLLTKKTLDKITVKEITDMCHVNRQTFYYNFHDVYDLARWIFTEEGRVVLTAEQNYGNWRENMNSVFTYLCENRTVVLNTARAIGRPAFEKFLKTALRPPVENVIKSKTDGTGLSAQDFNFIVDIYTMGIVAIALEWLDNDMPDSFHENLDRLEKLIAGTLDHIIDKFTQK